MISRARILAGSFLIWVTLSALTLTAATNGLPTLPDRYLLVVDISSPMRATAEAVQESVTDLLASGMQGQLKNGDQLGIWTYSDRLHTGEFKLVDWNDDARNQITRRVLQFLEKQRFTGTTDFSKVTPALTDVVSNSSRITVILFCDGDEVIRGTPFDAAIAQYFRENADTLRDKHTPIVIVMRGYKGRLIGEKISYAPWPVEFPPFPPEPKPAPVAVQTNSTPKPPDLSRTLATTKKGPIVFAQPLIVSGRQGPPHQSPAQPVGATEPVPSPDLETNAPPGASNAISPPVVEAQPLVPATPPGLGRKVETTPAGHKHVQHRDFRGLKLIGLGIVALVVVSGGFLMIRRPRARHRGSLISQSMEKGHRR